MTTGEKIRAARKEAGMTQKQLGASCNPPIPEITIRLYELGKRNPKIDALQRIAAVLNMPIYKILGIPKEIEIAANAFSDSKSSVIAAHDLLSSGDKENAIALGREIKKNQKRLGLDEWLVAAVDKFYDLNEKDQGIVVDLINRLYEVEKGDLNETSKPGGFHPSA